MQLALAHNKPVAAAVWLNANHAGNCKRLSAAITTAACTSNQKKSFFDCRCNGCGGLENQPKKIQQQIDYTVIPDGHQPDQDDDKEEDQRNELTKCSLYEEELDELLEDYFSDEDDENLDDESLDIDEDNQRIYLDDLPEPQGRRVPVFVGRCPRCNGYMVNIREHQFDKKDDHVYRCFNCGWRISPEYQNNRELMQRGTL